MLSHSYTAIHTSTKQTTTSVTSSLSSTNALPNIKKILESNQRILKKSDWLRKIFKDLPVISYKRDQNLADLLVHKKTNKSLKSKSPIIKYKEHEIKGCGRNCKICTMHVISSILDKKKVIRLKQMYQLTAVRKITYMRSIVPNVKVWCTLVKRGIC